MENKGFDPYPASLAAVVSWQTEIVGPKRPGQVSHGTAGRYLGAVINVHLENKWVWLPEAGEREYLASVRDSLGRSHGFSAPKVKQPITPEILHLWNDDIDITTHNGRVFKAASCLATHCYLRGCEFLWDNSSPTQCLHRRKWHVGRGGATIELHDTKPKKGIILTAMVPFLPVDKTCPVEAVEDMIHRCPFDLPMDGPLFVCEDGKPLARARMMEWTRAHLAKLPASIADEVLVPGADVGSAGHRSGGATGANRANVPEPTVNASGRWAPGSRYAKSTYSMVTRRDQLEGARASSAAGLAAATAARKRAQASTPSQAAIPVKPKQASNRKRKRTVSRSSLGVGDGRGPATSKRSGRNLVPSPRLRFPGES